MNPLRAADLEYELPEDHIARAPVEPRDAARLMVVTPDGFEHRRVRDLPELLDAGDLIVVNDTTVLPARLVGTKIPGGARIEGLFLDASPPDDWRVLLRSNRKLRVGTRIDLGGEIIELIARDGVGWFVRPQSGAAPVEILQRVGQTPIPPYIARSRQSAGDDVDDQQDRAWYQTTFAGGPARSVAAPTAGLHLTDGLFERLAARGIEHTRVRLHVGAGTFKPIEAELVDDHPMHTEWWEIEAAALTALNATRARGGRIVAIGTTTVRTLESLPEPRPEPDDAPLCAATKLLIQPGYTFRNVDAMMTNFHLPRSTLLALVAAHTGLERLHALYREAIVEGYRFYSYGDAMLLL